MEIISFLLTVLPVTLYFAVQEGGPAHATWGKRRAGLVVVGMDGRPVRFGRALLRSAVKFLPWQLAHTSLLHIPGWPFEPTEPGPMVVAGLIAAQGLVLVYVGTMLFTPSHRTPYDWVAGTQVTDALPPIDAPPP